MPKVECLGCGKKMEDTEMVKHYVKSGINGKAHKCIEFVNGESRWVMSRSAFDDNFGWDIRLAKGKVHVEKWTSGEPDGDWVETVSESV